MAATKLIWRTFWPWAVLVV